MDDLILIVKISLCRAYDIDIRYRSIYSLPNPVWSPQAQGPPYTVCGILADCWWRLNRANPSSRHLIVLRCFICMMLTLQNRIVREYKICWALRIGKIMACTLKVQSMHECWFFLNRVIKIWTITCSLIILFLNSSQLLLTLCITLERTWDHISSLCGLKQSDGSCHLQ